MRPARGFWRRFGFPFGGKRCQGFGLACFLMMGFGRCPVHAMNFVFKILDVHLHFKQFGLRLGLVFGGSAHDFAGEQYRQQAYEKSNNAKNLCHDDLNLKENVKKSVNTLDSLMLFVAHHTNKASDKLPAKTPNPMLLRVP